MGDEDDIEEMDIKWNMALLSTRADKFWKKTGKKISIQGLDVVGFDKSKVECFICDKMGHFTRECRAPRSQERGRRDNYKQGSKDEEQAPKALMAIDGKLETLKEEKEGVDGKLAGLLTTLKDIDNLIESQSSNSTDSQEPLSDARLISKRVANQEETPSLDSILSLTNQFEDILGVTTNLDESNGVKDDISNMETAITVSPTPTLRIHKDHPKSQIIGPLDTPIQTRNKSKEVESMQEELLQFKIQNVWTLVDCPKRVRPIGIKWALKNKKDKKRIAIKNKAKLMAQGHTQEEGIDYDEVFSPIARIKAIRHFLANASFMSFTVYQIDVKSAFLYGTINEEVYVMQPLGF
nr:putative ribonuclease H-like domain-containing protein [Tanacetum cinerariifolium]